MDKQYLEQLDKLVDEGLLKKTETDKLVQYNYTDLCAYTNQWNEYTIENRGNIYEKETGKLICKGMPKFFNFDQLSEEEQERLKKRTDFTVSIKYDGCLGFIYKYDGTIMCNSRGSFNSFVTEQMYKIINQYRNIDTFVSNGYNLIVEVICPETKIIVDYKGVTEFRLITAYRNGKEISREHLVQISYLTDIPIVSSAGMSLQELFIWQRTHDYTEEGFVLRYSDNYRVKIKSNDYLRIASAAHNLNMRTVWKNMRDNVIDSYLTGLPDELYKTGQEYYLALLKERTTILDEANKIAEQVKHLDNKQLGLYFKDNPNKYSGIVFNIRNNKPVDGIIIRMIEPKQDMEIINE